MPQLQEQTGFARAELSMLPALQDAPELYAPLPAADDPESRAAARDDTDFSLRAATEAMALAGGLMDKPPNMAKGLTFEVLQRFDEGSAALLDDAPTPQAESDARDAIGRARGRLLDWALPQEAAGRAVVRRQGLIDGLAQFRATAERQPEDVDSLHAEGAAAIRNAASWLGEAEAQQLGAQWRLEVYERSLSRVLDENPQEMAARASQAIYRDVLGENRQSALLHRAQERAQTLAQDEERARQRDRDQRDLQREAERWKFRADFAKSLRMGTARRRTLDDAEMSGLITKFERQRLEPKLIESELADRDDSASAAHVAEYLDGKSSVQPTLQNIAVHYKLVMEDVLAQAPSEDRGRLYMDYLRALGRHDLSYEREPIDTGLPPPTDAPVSARQMDEMLQFTADGDGEAAVATRHPLEGAVVAGRAFADFNFTMRLFDGLPTHNTPADAFRHAYWSFMATRSAKDLLQSGPESVKLLTDAHEIKTIWQSRDEWLGRMPGAQPLGEKYMDLYNNAVGRRLAADPAHAKRPAHEVILQALEDGLLQTKPMTMISKD